MPSVNKAILIGHVGKDPTVRNTQGGTKIVSFSVATSESWKDRATGERKEETAWHNIVVFDTRLADIAEAHVRKGSQVYIEGAIKPRKYTTQDGQERYVTEIVLQAFRGVLTLLTPAQAAPAREPERKAEPTRQPERVDPRGNPVWEDGDDEVPF